VKLDPFEAREFIVTLLTRDVLRDKLDKLELSIKKILPGIDIDAAKLMYYTSSDAAGKPLAVKKDEKITIPLMHDPAISFKTLPLSDQEKLIEKITNAVELCEKIKKDAKGKRIERYVDELMEAVETRKEDLVEITDKIDGTYDFDENFDILISNHPYDVLAKSSGQGWSPISSEKLGAPYQKGIFSDVQNGSAVAFLVGKKNNVINARVMLRVCAGERERGIGVENKIYYDNGDNGEQASIGSSILIARGVKAKDFHAYLVKILEQEHLTDYNTCTTPYVYRGYSDVAEKADSIIEYKKPKADTKNVKNKKTKEKNEKQYYK